MADHDLRGERRLHSVVRVLPALVLDEVLGPLDLADVVVERRGVGEHGVGADRRAAALGQVGDHQRVLEGARRLEGEAAQQRQVGVGELDQRDVGGHRQQPLEQRHREAGHRRDEQTADESGGHPQAELLEIDRSAAL